MKNIFEQNDYGQKSSARVDKSRLAIMFLCDNSISMTNNMGLLNQAVNRFVREVSNDDTAADVVDMAVVSFNNDPAVVQDWKKISDVSPIELVPGGDSTNLNLALRKADDMVRQQCRFYLDRDILPRVPYIVLVTDGYGGNVDEIAKILRQRSIEGKVQIWALCVPGYDKATIAKLTNGERVLQLGDEQVDFVNFFDMLTVVIKTASQSAPGEKIVIPPEENPLNRENCKLTPPDLKEWLNSNVSA